MTRKDYILIADALASSRPDDPTPYIGWHTVRTYLVQALRNDNPRFDAVKFIERTEKKGGAK